MGPWERDKLVRLLAAHALQPEHITHVVATHGHPDHVGNLNLFTAAAVHVVGFSVYSKPDAYHDHDFKAGELFKIAPGIEVMPTPGHTLSCVRWVLIVNYLPCFNDVVVICNQRGS